MVLSKNNIDYKKCYGGIGTEYAYSIQQASNGGFIVGGWSMSGTGDATCNNGWPDYWIFKIDVFGTILWQKCLGGSGEDYGYSFQQTSDGGYIFAGSSTSFDGDVGGNNDDNCDCGDYWIVKLGEPTLIETLSANNVIKIYPNPASKTLHINLDNKQPGSIVSVISLENKILIRKQIDNLDMELNISSLKCGAYIGLAEKVSLAISYFPDFRSGC